MKRKCQQLHQYQQNEQPPLILTNWTHKRLWHMLDVRNPGPGLGQATNVAVLNQLIESQHRDDY